MDYYGYSHFFVCFGGDHFNLSIKLIGRVHSTPCQTKDTQQQPQQFLFNLRSNQMLFRTMYETYNGIFIQNKDLKCASAIYKREKKMKSMGLKEMMADEPQRCIQREKWKNYSMETYVIRISLPFPPWFFCSSSFNKKPMKKKQQLKIYFIFHHEMDSISIFIFFDFLQ